MNCLYIILLVLASGMGFIAYFYKPWDKPKIIFGILISVFALWILMASFEFFLAQRAIANFKKKLLDGDIYELLAESGGFNLKIYRFTYYFAILNTVMGAFNLIVSVIGLLVRNKAIYIIGAILFIIEIFVILAGIFYTLSLVMH